jgi:TusA-related sulfurtransferase
VDTLAKRRKIDLRGEICPYTFVKSKLVIEEMNPGDILEVIVDFAPSAENIPRSMKNEGHSVLAVERIDSSQWRILIKKKKENS